LSDQIYSVKYRFTQHFTVPAGRAFGWCINYQPHDLDLMRIQGERRIRRLTGDAIILHETTYGKGQAVRKTKLVRLDREHLTWSNTHVAGPYRHSQFLYRILAAGRNASKLDFTGLLILRSSTKLSPKKLKQIAEEERKQDFKSWKHLAKAMSRELR
jgi:hypothetical protein